MTAGDGDASVEVAGRQFRILQLVSACGGAGLVVAYLLPWVEIVDVVAPAEHDQPGQDGDTLGEPVTEGALRGMDIAIFPELIAIVGLVVVGLSLFAWTRWTQLTVTFFGLAGTGVAMFMRETLREDEALIEVGNYVGFGSSFDPGIGLWIVLGLSALLIGTGFGGFLNSLDDRRDRSTSD